MRFGEKWYKASTSGRRSSTAEAITRFWALGLCLYQYLDSLCHQLVEKHQEHVTLGETLEWLRQCHTDLALEYVCELAGQGVPKDEIQAAFKPALRGLQPTDC